MKHSEEAVFVALTNGDHAQAQEIINGMTEADRLSLYSAAVDIAAMAAAPQSPLSPAQSEDAANKVEAIVDKQLNAAANVPYGRNTGRRFEVKLKSAAGSQLNAEEIRAQFKIVMLDIARRVGVEFVDYIDPISLDQFITISIIKNHDTAGLIRSLIRSFIAAYNDPQTNAAAYGTLEDLEEVQRTLLSKYALLRANIH